MEHTVVISSGSVKVTGVTAVVSVFEKEVEVKTEDNTLVIKGSGLAAEQLELKSGVILLKAERVYSVTYGKKSGRLDLKRLLK